MCVYVHSYRCALVRLCSPKAGGCVPAGLVRVIGSDFEEASPPRPSLTRPVEYREPVKEGIAPQRRDPSRRPHHRRSRAISDARAPKSSVHRRGQHERLLLDSGGGSSPEFAASICFDGTLRWPSVTHKINAETP